MKEIHFHNWARNGDLHVSRSFVKRLVRHTGLPCFYHHRRDPRLLADIPLTHLGPQDNWIAHGSYVANNALYINTWYGAAHNRYRLPGADDLVTFDTLYRLFNDATKSYLGFPLSDIGEPIDFLPEVDFNEFSVIKASEFIHARPHTKRALFDTVRCLSGQAVNFPMLPVLHDVALQRPDVTFYYTWPGPEPHRVLPENALWTREVHGVRKGCDLNENAYISTFCDLVVGRRSSTYTFCLLRRNLVERPVQFLAFARLPYPTWLGPHFAERIPLSCAMQQSAVTEHDAVVDTIKRALGPP